MYACLKPRILVCAAIVIAFFMLLPTLRGFSLENVVGSADKGVFLPVIMYHSILKDEGRWGKFVVSPETVEGDLAYLKREGFTAVLTADLVSYVYDGVPLPEKPVMITLDDGYYNNMSYLLPLLKTYNMKAIISVVGSFTERFSQADDHHPAYSHLTWKDLSTLTESGRVEIGNHSYDMHSNDNRNGSMKRRGESESDYGVAFTEDTLRLQLSLKENSDGIIPLCYTYPYGAVSRESIPLLKQLGFKATLTCREMPNYITTEPNTLYGINRYNRPSGLSTEEFMKRLLKR